jgi:Xaa-Pro dipeptidase
MADLDAALVTFLPNVRYLSGYSGSNGALLVHSGGEVLATDVRYETQAGQECPDIELVVQRSVAAALVQEAGRRGLRRVGFEAAAVTVAQHGDLQGVAREAGVELVPLVDLVEPLRVVKDEAEVEALRRACAISQEALAALLPELAPGLTEVQVAARLEYLMREGGAEAPAFETIVAAGENSAIPHHSPTGRELAVGDLLKIDFGARWGGYHADMTRTFVLGPAAEWQREVHALVEAAQAAGRAALAPGASLLEVDDSARSLISAAGHGDHFGHGLGHGVGLEIHEAPMIGYASTGILRDGTPVTVEPGVYLPGRGGVRIEDTLVVRPGGAESLTTAARELVELG